MTDRPILFSAAMVVALLAGRKTQTRRVIADGSTGEPPAQAPRIKVGDRLYVKEAVEPWSTGSGRGKVDYVRRCADQHTTFIEWPETWIQKRQPAMFMPRTMSRITLVVTDVRVQRLQDISDADAIAEGIERGYYAGPDKTYEGDWGWHDYSDHPHAIAEFRKDLPRRSYETLWDSLNAKRSPWTSNPFVAAYTFEVHKINIDRLNERSST